MYDQFDAFECGQPRRVDVQPADSQLEGSLEEARIARVRPVPATAVHMSSPSRKRRLAYCATALITFGFIYLSLRRVRFGDAWHGLESSSPGWLIPALGALALGLVLRAVRWRSLFEPRGRPPLGPVLNATLIGYLFNNILPARAGEAARVVSLAQRSAASPVEIVGTVVVERIYDVFVILTILFVARPWLPHVTWVGAASTVALVLAAGLAAAVVILALYGERPLRFALKPLRRLPLLSEQRLDAATRELVAGLGGLRRPRVALEAFAWTVVAWMASALVAYTITLALHLHVPFGAGVLMAVAVGISMMLPTQPGAVGVFEAACLLALQAYGMSQTTALPAALLFHLVNFVPPVLVGVMLLRRNSRRRPSRPRATVGAADTVLLEQRPADAQAG